MARKSRRQSRSRRQTKRGGFEWSSLNPLNLFRKQDPNTTSVDVPENTNINNSDGVVQQAGRKRRRNRRRTQRKH